MQKVYVRTNRENVTVSFVFKKFVTDWPQAQQGFFKGIVGELGELLTVRAQDFSANPSNALGDVWCRYQIFGGGSTITLHSDKFVASFQNLARSDYPTVYEILSGLSKIMKSEYTENGIENITISTNQHAEIIDSIGVDDYLRYFSSSRLREEVLKEEGVFYEPSFRYTLGNTKEGWVCRRMVEKSELVVDGLFATTEIVVSQIEDNLDFSEQFAQVVRISDLANRAIGIEEFKDDDVSRG